jgi:hypothetical protein
MLRRTILHLATSWFNWIIASNPIRLAKANFEGVIYREYTKNVLFIVRSTYHLAMVKVEEGEASYMISVI